MRILVTSAKGFVGRNLGAQLKNIRDGKARNYGVTVTEVYEYDLDSTHEALDKACFILAGIDEKSLLQAVDTAVEMDLVGDHGIPSRTTWTRTCPRRSSGSSSPTPAW